MDDSANRWDARYGASETEWFFGKEPSILGRLTVSMWKQTYGERAAKAIDLGCGEGRDSVFFAQQGWTVDAVDASAAGIEKARRLAAESGVSLRSVTCGDIREADLTAGYDLFFAHNSLSGLGDECLDMVGKMRANAPAGGMNAIRVFTNVAPRPEGDGMYLFAPGELKRVYDGWRVLYYGEDLLWHPQTEKHRSFADIIAVRA